MERAKSAVEAYARAWMKEFFANTEQDEVDRFVRSQKGLIPVMSDAIQLAEQEVFKRAALRIGKYRVSVYEHGGLWIANEFGEGMQVNDPVSMAALERCLDEFWRVCF